MVGGGGIYGIVHRESGKMYIGSACLFQRRWKHHRTNLRGGTHFNPKLQRAWVKYGEEAFSFEVIELVDDKTKLIEREQLYLDTVGLSYLYNLRPIANSCLGYKHGPAELERRRLQGLGRRLTQQAKNKIGDALRALQPHQVNEIRQRLAVGAARIALAEEYGVSYMTISRVARFQGYPEALVSFTSSETSRKVK